MPMGGGAEKCQVLFKWPPAHRHTHAHTHTRIKSGENLILDYIQTS